MARSAFLLLLCAALACDGSIGSRHDDELPPPIPGSVDGDRLVPGGGFTRLSIRELEASLDTLFPSLATARERFPEESFGRFDNDRDEGRIGTAFMDSALVVADSIVSLAWEDDALRSELLDCDEAAVVDCLSAFADKWPTQIIQRPLEDDERTALLALADQDLGNTEEVVGTALTALLVHPEFLYRVTVGTGEEARRPLAEREILGRISFFLWGQAPDDALRGQAATMDLHEPSDRRALAESMLDDERAAAQRSAFHAQWLGYSQMPREGLAADMWMESDALVERATGDGADYSELLLSPETFVTAELADHYGLAAPRNDEGGWTSYGATPRLGILARFVSFVLSFARHGLSNQTRQSRTEPTALQGHRPSGRRRRQHGRWSGARPIP